MIAVGVRFVHTIGDLVSDMAESGTAAKKAMPKPVREVAHRRHMEARRLARRRSGPHGKTFYKRITRDRTGPLQHEYGPSGTPKTEFVGAGYRTGGGNLDMPQSADGAAEELGKRLGIVLRGTWRV